MGAPAYSERGFDEMYITVPVTSNFYVLPRNDEQAEDFDRPPSCTLICECEPPIQDLLVGFEFWAKIDNRFECIIFSQSSSIMYLSFKKNEFRTVNISYPIHQHLK